MVKVLSIPYDEDSSFLKGSRRGPSAIQAAFYSDSTNTTSENGSELGDSQAVEFLEPVEFPKTCDPRSLIEKQVDEILAGDHRLVSLGGDHSVTYPILKSFARRHGAINLLQLDAHSDLYDEFEGNRFSHACPFARAHEDGLIKRHVQVGIRTMNRHQAEQAKRFAVEVITMRDWKASPILEFTSPVYVTLDLDVLDPAFAPGISHYEPGGANVRQVIDLIQNIDAPVMGGDIVELNPERDFQSMTAMVAAKLMKELIAKMI